MSEVLNIHIDIAIPTESLGGEMEKVREEIRIKFSMIGEDVIRFAEKKRAVKPKKEWVN